MNQSGIERKRISIMVKQQHSSIRSIVIISIALGILMFAGTVVVGQPTLNKSPITALDSKRSSEQSVSVETVYQFQQELVDPPVNIEAIGRTDELLYAFSMQMRAMQTENYEQWISGWDGESRARIESRALPEYVGPLPRRTPEQWKERWRLSFAQHEIKVVGVARTPDFCVVAYESKAAGEVKPGKCCFVFDRDGSRWLQTTKFEDHPVLVLWRSGQSKIMRIGEWQNKPRSEK